MSVNHLLNRLADESGRRGSNPRHQAWKACALPAELLPRLFHLNALAGSVSVGLLPQNGGGRIRTFEGVSRQIYSLLPLATWVPHQKMSRHRDDQRVRADGGNRTHDLPLTRRLLWPSELRQRRGLFLRDS